MMTPEHRGWPEFTDILSRALRPVIEDDAVVSWRYSGTFGNARSACLMLGLADDEISESEQWWREHGAHCDEEILLNNLFVP